MVRRCSYWCTSYVSLAPNTRRIVVNCVCRGWYYYGYEYTTGGKDYQTVKYFKNYKHASYQVILYWNSRGYNSPAWQTASFTTAQGYAQSHAFTFDTGTLGYDITNFCIRYYVLGYDSAVTYSEEVSSPAGSGYYFECNNNGYTSNLVGAAALAYGTMNWCAF